MDEERREKEARMSQRRRGLAAEFSNGKGGNKGTKKKKNATAPQVCLISSVMYGGLCEQVVGPPLEYLCRKQVFG